MSRSMIALAAGLMSAYLLAAPATAAALGEDRPKPQPRSARPANERPPRSAEAPPRSAQPRQEQAPRHEAAPPRAESPRQQPPAPAHDPHEGLQGTHGERRTATERGAESERSAGPQRDPERVDSPPAQRVPAYSRPRGDRPATGRAIPRAAAPRRERPIIIRNPYYYSRNPYFYSPLGYGAFGLGYFYYDPFWWSSPYPYPTYAPSYGYGYGYGDPVGGVRLKVKPRDAVVYVDGYYVGQVDDFDGVFQRLELEAGPHRIEVRAPGHELLVFEVRIQPGQTITYRGELRRP